MHELVRSLKLPINPGKNIVTWRERMSAQYYAFERACNGMWWHNVLDIGCGLAGIDALLVRKFGARRVHLLDGDGSASQVNGWNRATDAWNDVEKGVELVRVNGGPDIEVITHIAGRQLQIDDQLDLVISLRSWGHHYPIPVYLPLVRQVLRSDGMLILDIRRKTDGVQQLEAAGFTQVGKIEDHSFKCDRLMFVKD
jgi:SAM-dependent methyltransferase